MNEKLSLFLKGISIGFCDIIPGVSGGTVALITGIYSKFIDSLKNLNLLFVYFFIKYLITMKHDYLIKSRENFNRMNPGFLVVLFSGILLALIVASFIMPYLMNNFPVFTFSIFFGLILTSAVKILRKNLDNFKAHNILHLFGFLKVFFSKGYKKSLLYLKTHNSKFLELLNFVLLIFGFILGFIFADFSSLGFGHSYLVLFLSGFAAICAMLLPGISGSYVLLVLGQYEYVLSMIHNIGSNLLRLLTLILGTICGLVGFSRVISYLLKKFYRPTVFFLVGLMVGTLKLIATKILFGVLSGGFVMVIFFGVILGSLVVFVLDSF